MTHVKVIHRVKNRKCGWSRISEGKLGCKVQSLPIVCKLHRHHQCPWTCCPVGIERMLNYLTPFFPVCRLHIVCVCVNHCYAILPHRLSIFFVICWNALSNSVRCATSLSSFKCLLCIGTCTCDFTPFLRSKCDF